MRRVIRIQYLDGTTEDLELASYNRIEKGTRSLWLGKDKRKDKYHLTIGGNLLPDLTKVDALKIIRIDE